MTGREVHVLVGARPNLPKAAALFDASEDRPGLDLRLVHTGQHDHPALSGLFAADLGLPEPHRLLGPPGTRPTRLAAMTRCYREALAEAPPAAVLVLGDVDSTAAGAMAAAAQGVPIAHVEAGLRGGVPGMREEANRRLVDRLAARLYTHSSDATAALLSEGRDPADVVEVGNVMIDTVMRMQGRATRPDLPLPDGEFGLVTLHRAELLEDAPTLRSLLAALARLSAELRLVFVTHPRTASRLAELGWTPPPSIIVSPALLYSRFTWLLARARVVLTDSGGLQEEAACLGRPCVTLRPDTERPVTVRAGANRVVGRDPERLLKTARQVLREPLPSPARIPGWDGGAAARLLADLEGWLSGQES